MKGFFTIVDGGDVSGKGTIVDALGRHYEIKGLSVFDLRKYQKENGNLPEAHDIIEDVILSAEPTFCLIGGGLRDEIIKQNERTYSALSTAMAFALDREILYKRLIIPLLERGKKVIQERGFTTSLVYQPIQDESLTIEEILKLEGNRLALENIPDDLIICKVPAEISMERLEGRVDKQDDAIFEKLQFQRKAAERFQSDWFREFFESRGTKVHYLDASGDIPYGIEQAIKFIEK